MNSKNNNKLIKALLRIGKKHRILVYPTLAMVAVISAFSYLYRWSTSSGKRVVAAVLVGVLVISQSYFMTASANESELIEEEEQVLDITEIGDEPDKSDGLIDSKDAEEASDSEAYEEASDDGDAEGDGLTDARDDETADTEAGTDGESQPGAETKTTAEDLDKDTYEAGNISIKITDIYFQNSDQQTQYTVSAGTPDTTVTGMFPNRIYCTVVRTVDGVEQDPEPNYGLNVTWKNMGDEDGDTGTGSLHGNEFVPAIAGESTYNFDMHGCADMTALYRHYKLSMFVAYYDQYTVAFDLGYSNAKFSGNVEFSQASGGGYLGLVTISYQLPGAFRPKSDGSGETIPMKHWVNDDGVYYSPGVTYSQLITDAVTFHAVYNEVEVRITDDKNTTKYVYPVKDSTGTVGTVYPPDPVFGYEFAGWKSDNTTYKVGDSITFDKDMTLTVQWTPIQYPITYNANRPGGASGEGNMAAGSASYGTTAKLSKNTYTCFGYDFAGWAVAPNGEVAYGDSAGINNEALKKYCEGKGYTAPAAMNNFLKATGLQLYAVWTQSSVSFAGGSLSTGISTTYGTKFTENKPLVSKSTSGSYTVTRGEASLDGESVALGDYIQDFGVSTSGSDLIVTGTPKTVWDGSLTVQVNVKDASAGSNAEPSVLSVVLTAGKRTLTVAGAASVGNRAYDATTALTAGQKNSMKITLGNVAFSDVITLNPFTAEYETKDAGKNKKIVLGDVSLADGWGDLYELEPDWTVESDSEITKLPLAVTLEGTVTKYVGESVADEANQNFELDYAAGVPAATKEVVDRDGGLTVPNANGVKIPNTNVLVVTYQFPDVTTGAEVQVNADLKSDNYDVTCEKAICKLVVLQDEATDEAADAENGNYRISGTLGKKVGDIQWYTSVVTVSPVIQHAPDYYNLIREGKSPEWVKELVINDESGMNGREIQFTMKNSRTGAYTTDSDKMTFYVDSEAPKIDGEVTFTASSKASVLNNIGYFLEYGNFFKEDVTATMTITDNKSGCARIYYKVNNAEKWTEQELNGEESDTVSINIPLGTKSELLFYLEDVAGKTSEVTRLVGKNGGQEWVIENTDPQIVGYHIANLDGDRISNLSSGNWYNQPIQVVAEVKESDSGIHFADWYVNGDVDRKILEDGIHRGDSSSYVELPYAFKESGIYGVSLDVTDNATNTSGKSELTTVRIDLAAPVIHMDENVIPDIWTQVVEIPFTVTDDISGVYKVSAVAPNGDSFELQPAKDGTYTLKATMAGDYTIYARDEAYNEAAKTLTFDKISTEVPKNGVVSISPEMPDGTNGWYVTKPTITITPAEDTGRVPVTTYCKLWTGDTEPAEATQITALSQMRVPQDGIWHLRVWTETASGVKTETEYAGLLYVDSTAPECMVTKVVPDSTQQVVTFTVSDAVSGVDANRIRVVNGKTTVSSKVAALPNGKGYQGTFVVSSPGNYVVEVYDAAGNLSNTAAYQPMTMKVNTIRDITKTTATVSNITYRGTYPIASVKYEYKKASAKSYKTVTPYLVKDDLGNVTASYSFKNLKSNTKYEYRITSVSALGEALTYTGSFKTAGAEGINVSGKVVDADNANAKITVSLMEGNTVLQTTEIRSGKSFVFTKVPDGNYNITATNGITSKIVSVNIYKGKVIDPTGDILITLRNGMVATVLINGSKTPGISVSGVDDIFAYDTVNFTDADKQFIAEGGTVEFRLNVEYKTSGAISQNTLKALYKLMDDDEKVDMYLDLSLTKIRTYASGVIESRKSITQLSGGVTLKITVPLSSKVIKAAQKSVIRVHNNTANILRDLDKSANSYTLETNRFSTYVITYKTTGGTGNTPPSDNKPNDTKPGNDGGKGGKDNSDKTVKVYDSSPKTGDEAPLAAMGGILMISLAGIVVLKKKYK